LSWSNAGADPANREDPMTLIPTHALDWLVAALRDGRDYYRHAEMHTADAELEHAFGLAAEARDKLLAELRELPPEAAAIASTDAVLDRNAVPEGERYDLLRRQFDPNRPDVQAEALLSRERATLRLVESVFRSHPSLAVRRLMKGHFPALRQGAAIMQRLSQRTRAA
jgi:hypothetical protein